MIKFIKRLFHTRKYTRVEDSEKMIGYEYGSAVYNVKLQCECGKVKDIRVDDLFI